MTSPSQCCCYRDRRGLHRNFNSSFSITPSVNIVDAITNPSSMALNAIQIPIRWWAPTAQRTRKQQKRASTSRYWFKSISRSGGPFVLFVSLLLCGSPPPDCNSYRVESHRGRIVNGINYIDGGSDGETRIEVSM